MWKFQSPFRIVTLVSRVSPICFAIPLVHSNLQSHIVDNLEAASDNFHTEYLSAFDKNSTISLDLDSKIPGSHKPHNNEYMSPLNPLYKKVKRTKEQHVENVLKSLDNAFEIIRMLKNAGFSSLDILHMTCITELLSEFFQSNVDSIQKQFAQHDANPSSQSNFLDKIGLKISEKDIRELILLLPLVGNLTDSNVKKIIEIVNVQYKSDGSPKIPKNKINTWIRQVDVKEFRYNLTNAVYTAFVIVLSLILIQVLVHSLFKSIRTVSHDIRNDVVKFSYFRTRAGLTYLLSHFLHHIFDSPLPVRRKFSQPIVSIDSSINLKSSLKVEKKESDQLLEEAHISSKTKAKRRTKEFSREIEVNSSSSSPIHRGHLESKSASVSSKSSKDLITAESSPVSKHNSEQAVDFDKSKLRKDSPSNGNLQQSLSPIIPMKHTNSENLNREIIEEPSRNPPEVEISESEVDMIHNIHDSNDSLDLRPSSDSLSIEQKKSEWVRSMGLFTGEIFGESTDKPVDISLNKKLTEPFVELFNDPISLYSHSDDSNQRSRTDSSEILGSKLYQHFKIREHESNVLKSDDHPSAGVSKLSRYFEDSTMKATDQRPSTVLETTQLQVDEDTRKNSSGNSFDSQNMFSSCNAGLYESSLANPNFFNIEEDGQLFLDSERTTVPPGFGFEQRSQSLNFHVSQTSMPPRNAFEVNVISQFPWFENSNSDIATFSRYKPKVHNPSMTSTSDSYNLINSNSFFPERTLSMPASPSKKSDLLTRINSHRERSRSVIGSSTNFPENPQIFNPQDKNYIRNKKVDYSEIRRRPSSSGFSNINGNIRTSEVSRVVDNLIYNKCPLPTIEEAAISSKLESKNSKSSTKFNRKSHASSRLQEIIDQRKLSALQANQNDLGLNNSNTHSANHTS